VSAGAVGNGRGSEPWRDLHLRIDRRSRGYCRVTFDHPPIDAVTRGSHVSSAAAGRYGYVNRLIPDGRLDEEIDAMASRVAPLDHEAIAHARSYVDRVTFGRSDH